MKSDRTEMFARLQEVYTHLQSATEHLKDTRARGSQLMHLAATADELDNTSDMLAHVMTTKFWD